jgi:hypothetical protein
MSGVSGLESSTEPLTSDMGTTFEVERYFTCKTGPNPAPDCRMCATFARRRCSGVGSDEEKGASEARGVGVSRVSGLGECERVGFEGEFGGRVCDPCV